MIIVNDLCDFHAIDLYTSLSVTFVMNFNARYKYVYFLLLLLLYIYKREFRLSLLRK